MCLITVDQMHLGYVGIDLDLEPRTPTAFCTSGKLIALRDIPTCPGFRHLTVCGLDGKGVEVVVPMNLLVYAYCTGPRPKPQPRNRNLPT